MDTQSSVGELMALKKLGFLRQKMTKITVILGPLKFSALSILSADGLNRLTQDGKTAILIATIDVAALFSSRN
jgi:hypothetical protein